MNKPILFNTEMVQAIMDGRKTVTRRVIKVDCPDNWYCENDCRKHPYGAEVPCYISRKVGTEERGVIYPKYDVGDILWVRETWYYESHMHDRTAGKPDLSNGLYSHRYVFKASSPDYPVGVGVGQNGWRTTIHMPKEAARIFLRVTDVRAERLQEITADEARKEGITDNCNPCKVGHLFEECETCPMRIDVVSEFSDLWNSTIKPSELYRYGWDANPWVWVISFERCEKPEDFV